MEEAYSKAEQTKAQVRLRPMAVLFAAALAMAWPNPMRAAPKVKLHGYITGRAADQTLLILDDRLEVTSASQVVAQEPGGDRPMKAEEIVVGSLVEAEGHWLDRHKLFAEKITVDLRENEKKYPRHCFFQEEPADAGKIATGDAGESSWMDISSKSAPPRSGNGTRTKLVRRKTATANATLAASHINYSGIRRKDGKVEAAQLELGPPAPADAYKMPHDLELMRAKDPQTGINTLEFRHGNKVKGD